MRALDESISKWEGIVAGVGIDEGVGNCALCQTYLCTEGSCANCPVALRSGHTNCAQTPYENWNRHQEANHRGQDKHISCSTCKVIAIAELSYLKKLRASLPAEAPYIDVPATLMARGWVIETPSDGTLRITSAPSLKRFMHFRFADGSTDQVNAVHDMDLEEPVPCTFVRLRR
jgi:hypothetical protein